MAKTFKNLPRPGEPTTPKPTSERDFFDLSDVVELVKKPAEGQSKARNTNNIGNTGNTGNINESRIAVTAPAAEPDSARAASDGVRQTFVLSRGHLEQLRDYVHARRVRGEYTYSQKQALQEALDLLFASSPPVAQRPEQTRLLEQQQQERIKRGKAR
jgi:hypothetical protein